MKTTKYFFIIYSFFFFIGLCRAQSLDEIRRLQDNRQSPIQNILHYLQSTNPKIISQALLAIANRQDTGAARFVIPFFSHANSEVRSMAYFAIGQLNDSTASPNLFERMPLEKNPKCRDLLFQALGKIGTKNDLRNVLLQAEKHEKSNIQLLSKAVARFAIRNIVDSSAVEILFNAIEAGKYDELAVYALMRMNVHSIENKKYEKILLRLLHHNNADIRMWAASLAGAVQNDAMLQQLLNSAKRDSDWRVRVNALRSLQKQYSEKSILSVTTLLTDSNEHVSLTAIQTLNNYVIRNHSSYDTSALRKILRDAKKYSSRQRGGAAKILLNSRNDELLREIEIVFAAADEHLQAEILDGIGKAQNISLLPLIFSSLESQESIILINAVTAYGNLLPLMTEKIDSFLVRILPLYQRKDAGISYTIGVVLQDSLFTRTLLRPYLAQIHTAFAAMKSPDDLEPMIELMHLFVSHNDTAAVPLLENLLSTDDYVIQKEASLALIQLTGKTFSMMKREDTYSNSFIVEDNQQYSGAVIKTTKGNIRIRFVQEAAPYSIAAFIKLCKNKFYDGTPFHRVVSNFVIQGGDPLGNGSGGPGYSLRTEVFPEVLYKRGAVGLASAGKDTEGSQFFITHCPTPHLDGRYTLFAYTDDFSVVDKIMIGDKILEILLLPKN